MPGEVDLRCTTSHKHGLKRRVVEACLGDRCKPSRSPGIRLYNLQGKVLCRTLKIVDLIGLRLPSFIPIQDAEQVLRLDGNGLNCLFCCASQGHTRQQQGQRDRASIDGAYQEHREQSAKYGLLTANIVADKGEGAM